MYLLGISSLLSQLRVSLCLCVKTNFFLANHCYEKDIKFILISMNSDVKITIKNNNQKHQSYSVIREFFFVTNKHKSTCNAHVMLSPRLTSCKHEML